MWLMQSKKNIIIDIDIDDQLLFGQLQVKLVTKTLLAGQKHCFLIHPFISSEN
jgi:hypothetical protein